MRFLGGRAAASLPHESLADLPTPAPACHVAQSPYECSYTLPATVKCLDDEGCRFEVSARGHAVRRRDIPTRAQEAAAGGGAAALEVSKEGEQVTCGAGLQGCAVLGKKLLPFLKESLAPLGSCRPA